MVLREHVWYEKSRVDKRNGTRVSTAFGSRRTTCLGQSRPRAGKDLLPDMICIFTAPTVA